MEQSQFKVSNFKFISEFLNIAESFQIECNAPQQLPLQVQLPVLIPLQPPQQQNVKVEEEIEESPKKQEESSKETDSHQLLQRPIQKTRKSMKQKKSASPPVQNKTPKSYSQKRKTKLSEEETQRFITMYECTVNKQLIKQFNISRHILFRLKNEYNLVKDLTFLQKQIQNKSHRSKQQTDLEDIDTEDETTYKPDEEDDEDDDEEEEGQEEVEQKNNKVICLTFF